MYVEAKLIADLSVCVSQTDSRFVCLMNKISYVFNSIYVSYVLCQTYVFFFWLLIESSKIGGPLDLVLSPWLLLTARMNKLSYNCCSLQDFCSK